jgi:cephalosporin-C deacetylase-like acetyl esterase
MKNILVAYLLIAGLMLFDSGMTYAQANAGLFSYNTKEDYKITEDSAFYKNNILVRGISFISCNPVHGRVKAYLVMPSSPTPYAGIIYFHWLGQPNGNRNEFLDEAVEMADHSVFSILIQGYFPWTEPPVSGDKDRQKVIDQTIDLRRAMDILLMQPGIDNERIAFVGHDYGAMFGSIMAGIDRRIKACVLVTGMGNFGDWSLKYWKKPSENGAENYRKSLAPLDPIGYISSAKPTALFFQFANKDIYITKETALQFYNAASEPKLVKWYDTGHEMMIPDVKKDRVEWVKKQLGIR